MNWAAWGIAHEMQWLTETQVKWDVLLSLEVVKIIQALLISLLWLVRDWELIWYASIYF